METLNTVPVLIRFQKLHLDQTDTVDHMAVAWKDREKQGMTIRGERRKIPIRSFSLHSVFANRKQVKKQLNMEYKEKIAEAVLEIDKFERDFVLPVIISEQSCQSIKTKSSYQGLNPGISNISMKNKHKIFHSSSNSIHTEADSGAFSRLSSSDSDSDYSDISINSTKNLKYPSENNSNLDVNMKSSISTNTSSFFLSSILTKRPLHLSEHCKSKVTVNGVCYHCA